MPRYKLYLPLDKQPFLYRFFARLLSWVYALLVNIRNELYDRGILRSTKLPGICISVGNISVGGTGKSPFLMDVAEHLVREALSPAILTRGYKSSLKKREVLVLLAGKVLKKNFTRTLSQYPDEAMMYSHRMPTVPVIISQDRSFSAQWFLQQNAKPTHWILDDGFQHRKLARDLDIVLLDAQSPYGNGELLPLGSLREPLRSLKRAHCVCFTRATPHLPPPEIEASLKQYFTGMTVKLFFDFTIRSLNKTARFDKACEPVLAVCGIAQPEKFLSQIAEKNISIEHTYIVGDHDPFNRKKMQDSLTGCNSVLTTEKDYWRNPSIFDDATKPVFIAELRIFPSETNKQSIFEFICRFQKSS